VPSACTASDDPELALADNAFREPLFFNNHSSTLAIAYSHRQHAEEERTRIRNAKRKEEGIA
jgi:hypothetical protein